MGEDQTSVTSCRNSSYILQALDIVQRRRPINLTFNLAQNLPPFW